MQHGQMGYYCDKLHMALVPDGQNNVEQYNTLASILGDRLLPKMRADGASKAEGASKASGTL